MKQFETKHILPNRKTKSARGHPATWRKLQKQFKNPHFKNAQAYLGKDGTKNIGGITMLNQMKGQKRFKTFRANNELYYRIEASSNIEMKEEQKIYNELMQKLGSSLPSEMHSSKQMSSVASTMAYLDEGKSNKQSNQTDTVQKYNSTD